MINNQNLLYLPYFQTNPNVAGDRKSLSLKESLVDRSTSIVIERFDDIDGCHTCHSLLMILSRLETVH